MSFLQSPEHPRKNEFRSQVILFWTLAIALPVTVLFHVEVWLQTTYTGGLFHEDTFLYLYTSGIFRYRLLGRVLFLQTYRLLLHLVPHTPFPMPRDAAGDLPFVLAYALFNGLNLLLANFAVLCLMWVRGKGFRTQDLPLYLYTFLLIATSMAVVTPYDQLAYLLLVLSVVGARASSPGLGYGIVAVSAIAGTLNRETEFLASALLFTVALFTQGSSSRRYLRMAALHLSLCLAVYVALRLVLPGQANVTNSVITFGGKWAPAAAVFVAALFAAALIQARLILPSLRPAWVFTLLSLPYLTLVILTGVLRELRLLVPVVLCIFCLYLSLSREESTPTPA